MLAFRPQGEGAPAADAGPARARTPAAGGSGRSAAPATVAAAVPPAVPMPAAPSRTAKLDPAPRESAPRESAVADIRATAVETATVHGANASPGPLDAARWAALLEGANLRGPVRELAHNVVPLELGDGRLRLGLAPQFEHLRSDGMLRSLGEALAPALGAGLRIAIEPLSGGDTLAERLRREQQQRQGHAESTIASDPAVQSLVAMFDARVVPNSTRPLQSE
jgi:DNA polymerase-3 subunit gamma/tau